MDNPPVTSNTYEEQGVQSVGGTNPTDKLVCEAAEDETFFLRKDVPAQHLLKLLQKEVGMPSSTSSAVSSVSETSLNTASSAVESKITKVSKLIITDRSMVKSAGGPVETHLAQQQTARPESVSDPDQSGAWSSGTANVTLGPRSTQPDDSSELLHRELLSEVERLSSLEAGAENTPRINPTPPDPSATPALKEMSEGKPSLVGANLGGGPWTGPFSAGVERVHREQELWSSGNQTGIDGSYLGFLPQSQSTPGVFMVPPKSGVKAKLGQLSAIESDKENQSNSGAASQSAVPMTDTRRSEIAGRCQEETLQTSAQVQSLPTLNYMQKVDAWRANQSPRGPPLFDSLTLQGFSSMPPKKKAFDAPSDTRNRVLTQHSQQPPVLGASNPNIDQGSSTAAAGSSSSKRGEAVGGGPCDKPDRGPAPSPARGSSFGKSQSVSSLSTVVASARQHQQTVTPPEPQEAASQERAPPHPGAKPSPLTGLGHFSDTSHDQDVTPSSSQDSYSGVKVGLSVGASSVVSLELDHYTPNWPTKPPALPPDLNIDERIPCHKRALFLFFLQLYLRNLGIDQSPSSILTPFAPRGPIREPEFSPTDFCTVKGSTGTPTKSTQPSEGIEL
ncbi:unnamed protein product [Menidia menidia]|uniref:(Atlantic silverside) hypothetical protein n=1 Tax=Menidia menidia TaxID=238744 RepID=A0A8S4AM90_9TELE|nr:unnamed protein product [Menidia menidia]